MSHLILHTGSGGIYYRDVSLIQLIMSINRSIINKWKRISCDMSHVLVIIVIPVIVHRIVIDMRSISVVDRRRILNFFV